MSIQYLDETALGKFSSGHLSSSSDSEEDEDVFGNGKETVTNNSLISNEPIRWDEDTTQRKDKKNETQPRQKLLPSFTKCGSIEMDANLPPPPILRPGSYKNSNKKQQHTAKSITSSDKISLSNGANNVSKRNRRKQNTALTTTTKDSTKTKVTEKSSREKSKPIFKSINLGDRLFGEMTMT